MIFRSRVVVPDTFRPDHQTGRVLLHIQSKLQDRRELVERQGERLVIANDWPPSWNARGTGRGVVAFEREPTPGRFTNHISFVREALWTSSALVILAGVIWILGSISREALLLAEFALGIWIFWTGWGLYKVLLLRRLVRSGIEQVAA